MVSTSDEFAGLPPAMTLMHFLLLLLAVVAGAFAAVVVAPAWLPGLVTSLLGPRPTAYWYLSRASALVAYWLLWLSMALGLLISNRLARVWPGGPTAFDLHQHASLLGLAFALFHGLILTGDRYIDFTLAQVLTPFASAGYRPFWVGLGQTAFYGLALVGLSFYAVRVIGRRLWRAIHFLSFAAYALALIHGVTSGSDSTSLWVSGMYWATGGSLLFLAVYRLLACAVDAPRLSAAAGKKHRRIEAHRAGQPLTGQGADPILPAH
jgi:predicted ferric reductase